MCTPDVTCWALLGLSSTIFYSYVTLVTLPALGGGVLTPDVTYWALFGLGTILLLVLHARHAVNAARCRIHPGDTVWNLPEPLRCAATRHPPHGGT